MLPKTANGTNSQGFFYYFIISLLSLRICNFRDESEQQHETVDESVMLAIDVIDDHQIIITLSILTTGQVFE